MKQLIVLGALMTSGSAFAHVSSCHDFTCAYPEFYKSWTEHLSAHADGKNLDETIAEDNHGHSHEHTASGKHAPKLARRGHRTEPAEQVDNILAEYEAPHEHEVLPPVVAESVIEETVVEEAVVESTIVTGDVIPEGAIHIGEIGTDAVTEALESTPVAAAQAPAVVNTKIEHHEEHQHKHHVDPYKIAYPDGSTYRGDINKGRRHGYGVMTWPDGTRYLGQFFNDQFHGHGQLRWADGTSYTGNFAHDELQGKGAMSWADGIRFNGEMDHSLRHGKGTYTLPDGRRVIGVFANDHAAGQGLLIYPDGRHRGIIFGKDVAIKHRGLPNCLHNSVPGCR